MIPPSNRPITYFDTYLNLSGFAGKFDGLSSSDSQGKNCLIHPNESCTKEELQEMYRLRDQVFNWSRPDFFIPKLDEFKKQVFAALPDVGKLQMAPILMTLTDEFIFNPENMQVYWSAFKANMPAWLTNEVAVQIEQIAKDCNILLEVTSKT